MLPENCTNLLICGYKSFCVTQSFASLGWLLSQYFISANLIIKSYCFNYTVNYLTASGAEYLLSLAICLASMNSLLMLFAHFSPWMFNFFLWILIGNFVFKNFTSLSVMCEFFPVYFVCIFNLNTIFNFRYLKFNIVKPISLCLYRVLSFLRSDKCCSVFSQFIFFSQGIT